MALRDVYAKGYANLAVSEVAGSRSRMEFLEKQVEQLTMNGHSNKSEIDMLKERMNSLEEILRESLILSREIQKKTGKNE